MRTYGLVLTALLLTGTCAEAQTRPATPPAKPAAKPAASDAALAKYLAQWEAKMGKVTTLSAQITRLDKDKAFETTQKLVGKAQYMKAGTGPSALNLALLEMNLDGKTAIAEKFVCTGTYLYQFVPSAKEIRAYELPKRKPGQVADDNFLSFLFGMKATEAKRRYTLKLAKEDKWYVYIDIAPRFAADRADFARARLVLNKDTFLPRQLWFEHANGNEVTWDIPRVQSGISLNRRDFDAPKPPPGWKLKTVSRTATPTPRVVRPAPSGR
jgi:TIGR03009 family protein